MGDPHSTSEYLKIADAARLLGVTQRWLYRRITSGDLPASKVGGLYFIRRADLQNLLEQGRVSAGEDSPPPPEPVADWLRCGACLRVIEPGQGHPCLQSGCGEVICQRCAAEGVQHCASHTPTPRQRREQAQALLASGQVPLLVPVAQARLREVNLTSRIHQRLQRFSTLIHPTSGEVINVQSWEAVLQQGDERAEVMRVMGKVVLESSAAAVLPLNAWLRYRLPGGKGRKAPPLEIHVRALSRLARMVRDGFDTVPLGVEDLMPWVQRLVEDPAAAQPFRIVLLASITGWDAPAREVVAGRARLGAAGMGLVQRHGLIYLFDLHSGELVFNDLDERASRYAELFNPALSSEEAAGVRQAVEKDALLYDSLSLEMAGRSLPYPAGRIRHAFEELAASGRYTLQEIPGVGLTLVKKN